MKQKEVEWIKKDDGIKVAKVAGKAIVVTAGLVAFGITLGAVNNAFGWKG